MTLRILGFLLFRPAGLMILSALFMGMSAVMILGSQNDLPDRAGLRQLSGLVEEAAKVRHQRKGNVWFVYELYIKSENGEVVKLRLQQERITEEQVSSLIGRSVTALFRSYDSYDRVWELASAGTKVIDYEATRREEAETQALAGMIGPYVAGGGFLISLLGFLLLMRRRRIAESTA